MNKEPEAKLWMIVLLAVFIVFLVGGMGLQVMFNNSQVRFNAAVTEFQSAVVKQFDLHDEQSHMEPK